MPDGDKQTAEQKRFQTLYEEIKPRPPVIKNSLWAFVVGGLICTLGEGIYTLWEANGLSAKEAAAATSIIMIFFGAALTAVGVYDTLGKYAGAGSVVPVTGFANSVAAPAMEFKREGLVFGTGAKMFVIAGPVIVYGVLTAVIFGLIHWVMVKGDL